MPGPHGRRVRGVGGRGVCQRGFVEAALGGALLDGQRDALHRRHRIEEGAGRLRPLAG
jgi:hypothetical protein